MIFFANFYFKVPNFMFPQLNRLNTKDIKYINRQRKAFFTKTFMFCKIPQYPNRKYHQISLHIPKVLTKFATKRHFIKRRLLYFLSKNIVLDRKINNNFYKIFINFNKKNIPLTKWNLDKLWKYDFTKSLVKDFERDWKFYLSKNFLKNIRS